VTQVIYYPGYSQTQVADSLLVQTIASITQANPMVITTNNSHKYVPGMMVTFLIPGGFGMTQLNGINAQVTAASGKSITCGIDSTGFYPFAYPSPLPSAYTNPSVIPNSSGPYLPPLPLPTGNQDSFVGTTLNAGLA
jgi:hypothetical protein